MSFTRCVGRGLWSAAVVCLAAGVVRAEPEKKQPEQPPPQFKFNSGPTTAPLGAQAQIQVPKDYEYLDPGETKRWMVAVGNTSSGKELGLVQPKSPDEDWVVIFEFDQVGYVKDDEKDELDADAILESISAGTEAANEERAKRGIPPMKVTGWKYPPSYDEKTKNLQWCIAAESEGQPILNYNTRILGRNGVMEATLVCGPDNLDAVVTKYKGLIAGYNFTPGNTYGEFRAGDKVATYGLAALVAGGGFAAAAKTGLLAKLGGLIAKLGKGIIVVIIAALAGIKALFSKIFGGRKSAA